MKWYQVAQPIFLGLITCLAFTGCSDSGDSPTTANDPPEETQVTLSGDVQPIFSGSCALGGCHGSSPYAGNLNLTAGSSYGAAVGVASSIQPTISRVEPGEPSESFLYLAITGGASIAMPPGGSVPTSSIEKVGTWITQGALDN
jgi:hypothetical protein